MTAQPDPYVRVYYRITDDPKFADVYDNDAALALWLRLLITADATWPAAAPLPQLDRDALTTLVTAGLVDLVGATRYRIHGLESERSKRTNKGTQMAAARWSGKFDAQAYAQASEPECTSITHSIAGPHAGPCSPSNSEPSRATPSNSNPSSAIVRARDGERHGLPNIDVMVATTAEEVVGRSMATLHGTWATELDRLVEDRGSEAVARAMRQAAAAIGGKPSWAQLVAGVRNILEPLPSSMKAKGPAVDEGEEFLRRFREGKVKL